MQETDLRVSQAIDHFGPLFAAFNPDHDHDQPLSSQDHNGYRFHAPLPGTK